MLVIDHMGLMLDQLVSSVEQAARASINQKMAWKEQIDVTQGFRCTSKPQSVETATEFGDSDTS
eukprot:1707504-Amphidinium_carterae.1